MVKPTYTSHKKREITSEDFPDIMLCPEPAINVTAMKSEGYEGIWEYFMGLHDFGSKEFEFEWTGYKSHDVKKASAELSTVTSTSNLFLWAADFFNTH